MNAVSKPEQSYQILDGVFFQTCTKSFQITNNILHIVLPKYGQISAHYFSLNDLPNNGPITNCATETNLGKIQNLNVGATPPQKKVGGLDACGPPDSATYA